MCYAVLSAVQYVMATNLGRQTISFINWLHRLPTSWAMLIHNFAPKKPKLNKRFLKEEEQFAKTLSQGLRLLSQELETLKAGDTLAGEIVFKLYDTYGFPADLTADILREKDISIDENGFEQSMNEQRQRARRSRQIWHGL